MADALRAIQQRFLAAIMGEGADAEALIVAAVEKVYSAHGISVDRLLADPMPARPQLELLEECA